MASDMSQHLIMSVPTATTSRMAFDANNPDHLAALISGLEEEDRKLHRKIGLETRDKKGEILDSLAHLAVCRNSGQILAIGAVTVDKAIELVVADNGPVEQEVRSFLKSFLTSLSDIRTHIKSSSINASKLPEGSPPSLSAELKRIGDHQLEEELYTLKISAILHNLPKIRKRFNKHIIHFQAFRTSFVGHVDDQPEAMIILVNKLNTLLDALAEALLTLTSSHNDADALEIVLLATKSANKYCVRNLEELNRCTQYIESTSSQAPRYRANHLSRYTVVAQVRRSSLGIQDSQYPCSFKPRHPLGHLTFYGRLSVTNYQVFGQRHGVKFFLYHAQSFRRPLEEHTLDSSRGRRLRRRQTFRRHVRQLHAHPSTNRRRDTSRSRHARLL